MCLLMPSGFRPPWNNKLNVVAPRDEGKEGQPEGQDPTYLVWRLLQHRCLPLPVQFSPVPVAWLVGTGIQKMLPLVLKYVYEKKLDSRIWERRFLTTKKQEAGLWPWWQFLHQKGHVFRVPNPPGGFRPTHSWAFPPSCWAWLPHSSKAAEGDEHGKWNSGWS